MVSYPEYYILLLSLLNMLQTKSNATKIGKLSFARCSVNQIIQFESLF